MLKKKKKERYELSFRESVAWTWKAVKLLHSLAPGEMELDFTADIVGIIREYIDIYIIARIIDELANARRPEKLLWLAVGFLINMLIYQVLHYLFFHTKQYKGNFRGEKKQRLFDRKLAELDYVDAERQEIRDAYYKIQRISAGSVWESTARMSLLKPLFRLPLPLSAEQRFLWAFCLPRSQMERPGNGF